MNRFFPVFIKNAALSVSLALAACGGQTPNAGGSSSSSGMPFSATSSSNSSTTSSSSTSSSSGGFSSGNSASSSASSSSSSSSGSSFVWAPDGYYTSTSSSSSSSSGIPDGPTYDLEITEYCESSVGINHGTHFEMPGSLAGRIDFPGGRNDSSPIFGSSLAVEYINTSAETINMQLWVNVKLQYEKERFPPTSVWTRHELRDIDSTGQVTLTSAGEKNGLSFRSVNYSWKINCSSDCVRSEPITSACPGVPVPGAPLPAPVAPEAQIEDLDTKSKGPAPLTVQFRGTSSYDANREKLSYRWEFDDGEEGTTGDIEHTFHRPGIYFVRLTVTDPTGLISQAVVPIEATMDDPDNTPPIAQITADRYNLLRPHTKVNLSAAQSTDRDGDPLEYVWFVPGNAVLRGRDVQLDLNNGNGFDVLLAVSDGRGGVHTLSRQFAVRDPVDGNCSVSYYDFYPRFVMDVVLYNNSDTPVKDWRPSWLFDSPIYFDTLFDAVIEGENPYTVRGFPNVFDVAPFSWVRFYIHGSSSTHIENIGITPQNGLLCVTREPHS